MLQNDVCTQQECRTTHTTQAGMREQRPIANRSAVSHPLVGAYLRHMSGALRSVPSPEQGTSHRMRSNLYACFCKDTHAQDQHHFQSTQCAMDC